MHATILGLATEVPPHVLSQENFGPTMGRRLGFNEAQMRLLKRITSGSAITKRHTTVPDFLEEGFRGSFFGMDEKSSTPKTSVRNDFYKKEAPNLAESVCRAALQRWGGDPKAITHVISVSCTGMVAPGIEFLMMERLGLSLTVERLGINFMGCFGAFKGLAIAKALGLESPQHRILVVCTELCSLHFQEDHQVDTMVANALFADGAAAIVVGTVPRAGESPLFEIHRQGSAALANTLNLMTWEAGDHGYKMRLSAAVPEQLEAHITPFVQRILGSDISFQECIWAIHPGGKAILDAITNACSLDEKQVEASWKVLKTYGNMSSPTFLFVLDEVLKTSSEKKWIVGLGFGPGLSIEGIFLKRMGSHVAG